MALNGHSEEQFEELLYNVVSPSHPISSIEHLWGRSKECSAQLFQDTFLKDIS
ncbi:MAG: hypothetical protein GJ680_08365 [Alteromonadaceae bacterium]|nr:hypothetical protein [Alteromonadaceae bacterium]